MLSLVLPPTASFYPLNSVDSPSVRLAHPFLMWERGGAFYCLMPSDFEVDDGVRRPDIEPRTKRPERCWRQGFGPCSHYLFVVIYKNPRF